MVRVNAPHIHDEPSQHYAVSEGVRASTSDDGLVLLDLHGGVLFASNNVGARIWQLIEQCVDCADIARRVAVDFDVSLDRAATDVSAFVSALVARGLVSERVSC